MKHLPYLLCLLLSLVTATAAEPKGIHAEIAKAYQHWDTALCGGDIAGLEKIYADEARLTGPAGEFDTKQSWIARVKSGEYKCADPVTSELVVRSYGEVAVATGIWKATEFDKGVKNVSAFRFTDVWTKREGRWQVVASQVSPIAPPKK